MTEELDKLEAAINEINNTVWLDSLDKQQIKEILHKHLDAQRQAPADRAAVLDAVSNVLAWAEVGVQSAPRGKTIPDLNWCGKTIRAALTNSVPGDVVEKAKCALETVRLYIQQEGQELRDLYPVFGLDGGKVRNRVSEALRELEPWVKGEKK
jgi:hypothetical protein